MEVFLVYEFTYFNYNNGIDEKIEFFGIFKNKQEAINRANAVIKIVKDNFSEIKLIIDKSIKHRRNPFKEVDNVLMYDKEDTDVLLCSINIKKFEIH